MLHLIFFTSHFIVYVSAVVYDFEVSAHFEHKKPYKKKLTKFTRIFELSQVFMYSVVAKILGYS